MNKYYIYLFLFPWGVPNLETAIDKALEKGNGNIMVDQVTYYNFFSIGIGYACFVVEGTVLKTAQK